MPWDEIANCDGDPNELDSKRRRNDKETTMTQEKVKWAKEQKGLESYKVKSSINR